MKPAKEGKNKRKRAEDANTEPMKRKRESMFQFLYFKFYCNYFTHS